MSSTDDMDARHGRMLAELAEAGMSLARGLYAATQQKPVSNADFALLAEAFHTVSRSIRQTVALEFKLKHEPRQPAAPKPEPKPEPAPAPPPPAAPRVRPEQVYWNEHERADWNEPLDEALGSGDTAAINAAIEASVARIQRGLTKAERTLSSCHPGLGKAQDRDPLSSAPAVHARTRSALLSTSSPMGPGLRVPRNRDDSGGGGRSGGKAPRPPPWHNSD